MLRFLILKLDDVDISINELLSIGELVERRAHNLLQGLRRRRFLLTMERGTGDQINCT